METYAPCACWRKKNTVINGFHSNFLKSFEPFSRAFTIHTRTHQSQIHAVQGSFPEKIFSSQNVCVLTRILCQKFCTQYQLLFTVDMKHKVASPMLRGCEDERHTWAFTQKVFIYACIGIDYGGLQHSYSHVVKWIFVKTTSNRLNVVDAAPNLHVFIQQTWNRIECQFWLHAVADVSVERR